MKIIIYLFLPFILLGSGPGDDPGMPLSIEDQIPLLLKILSYDKTQSEGTEPFTIGVIYQERFRYSETTMREVLEATEDIPLFGERAFRVVPIALDDDVDLVTQLRQESISVVYVAPLRAYDVNKITEATRGEGLISTTGVPAYLSDGLCVSLSVERNRPVIMINTVAATAEGAEFHSQLLKLASLIG